MFNPWQSITEFVIVHGFDILGIWFSAIILLTLFFIGCDKYDLREKED